MENGRKNITIGGKWRGCQLYNLMVSGQDVVFMKSGRRPYGTFETGVVLTGAIDSNEQNYAWSNILIDAEIPENAVIRVYCYASDSRMAEVSGRYLDLDAYLCGRAEIMENESLKDRIKRLGNLYIPAFSGARDGLINEKGRYLWLKIEFLVPDQDVFRFHGIRIAYPNEKLIQYLPQIYRDQTGGNDFFKRFMDIFETIFFDIENEVESIPKSLDYTRATGEMLRCLASFICLDSGGPGVLLKDDAELRKRISGAMEDYREIGTRKGVEHFIEKELGVHPIIIEYFDVKKMVAEGRDRNVYRELFGENPYRFFILLPEEVLSENNVFSQFLKELQYNIPAQTEMKVVLLKKSVVLGRHTYLGVNSTVSDYNYVSIDANSSISYDTLIGGDKDEEQ